MDDIEKLARADAVLWKNNLIARLQDAARRYSIIPRAQLSGPAILRRQVARAMGQWHLVLRRAGCSARLTCVAPPSHGAGEVPTIGRCGVMLGRRHR